MTTRLVLVWLHLLALGFGLAGAWSRARAIRDSLDRPDDPGAVRRAYIGHAWWSTALAVWLVTGIWRLVGATGPSGAGFGMSDPFLLKIALFVAVLALEAWPMMALVRWRSRSAAPDPRDAGRIEVISYVQCALVAAIVLASVAAPRGDGTTIVPTPAGSDSAGRPATSAAPGAAGAFTDDAPEPLEPSGTETVTADNLALLVREIAMPLDGVNPTTLRSNFDERRGGGSRQHRALDIMAPRGTPIRSAAKGRVLQLFSSGNGGLMVYAADSSERFILMYAHLDAYAPGLREGAALERGQVIGTVGSTGNASPTAPHLHFAVARSADVQRWSRGQPIDPLPVLVASVTGRPVGQ